MIGDVTWRISLGDYVAALSVAPSGATVAGSLAGDVVLVDADGNVVRKPAEHPFGVLSAAWSPDGSLCAVGGHDAVVRIIDSIGDEIAVVDLDGWVARLAWSSGSDTVAAAAGRRLALIDRAGALVHHYPPVSSTITDVAWTTNDRRVGVTSYGGITWYEPGALPSDVPARVHEFKGSPLSLVLAPNGRWACAGFQDASIHLWRLWSGDDLQMSGYPAKIQHLAFRHDTRWMASSCLGELTVWDFYGKGPEGKRPAQGSAHRRHISCLAWEPGGERLVTGGADGRLVLWPSPRSTITPLRPLAALDSESAVSAVAWLADGSAIVVGRADGTVELLGIEP
jgi:WD40 repeat protein